MISMTQTIDDVKKRLREAAETIRRIPKVMGPQGYGNSWPDIVRQAVEAYGYQDAWSKRPPPQNDEIDRAWEAVEWLNILDAKAQKMLWAWASGVQVWRLAQMHHVSESKLRRWRDESCAKIAKKVR